MAAVHDNGHTSTGPVATSRAALDVMLTDAALEPGGVRRFVKPTAALKAAAALARRPDRVARRVGALGSELGTVARGRSERTPARGDRRFTDPAWQKSWLWRRTLQSYLAVADTVNGLIDDAGLDWRAERQARFAAGNVIDALSPSNFPWSNPTVIKETVDLGGANLLRGRGDLPGTFRGRPTCRRRSMRPSLRSAATSPSARDR